MDDVRKLAVTVGMVLVGCGSGVGGVGSTGGASSVAHGGSSGTSGASSSSGRATSGGSSGPSSTGGESSTGSTSAASSGGSGSTSTSTSGGQGSTGSGSSTSSGGGSSTTSGASSSSGGGSASATSSSSSSGGSGTTGGFTPEPFPIVGANNPAGVVARPQVVTVTFSDDPNGSQLGAYDDWLLGSTWLSQVGADYGVGLGTNQNFPLADSSLDSLADGGTPDTFLRARILDGTLPFPQTGPDGGLGNTLYVLLYPAGAPNVLPAHDEGIHACELLYPRVEGGTGGPPDGGPNPNLNYAVLQATSGLSGLEVAVSHEIIEGTTDPCGANGYREVGQGTAWDYYGAPGGQGEVGDLCVFYTGQDSTTGYPYQRVWSTSAAAAMQDPCIPAPSGIYANVSPSQDRVAIPAGQSATVTLTGWSTASTSPWTLSYALTPLFTPQIYVGSCGVGSPGPFSPGVQLGATQIGDGQTVQLTLSVPGGTACGSVGTFVVKSGADGFWPLAVVAQ